MTQLERFRKDNGMTQKELADLLGIGQSFVSLFLHRIDYQRFALINNSLISR